MLAQHGDATADMIMNLPYAVFEAGAGAGSGSGAGS